MPEQEQQRFLVAMRVQPQVLLDREVDNALHLRTCGGLAVDVEFADAAIIAALVFGLDQIPNRRIVEPGLDVAARAVGPDERHDRKTRCLGIDKLVCALVRPAGGYDAGDIVAPEYLQNLVELVVGARFLIVVQVCVENPQRLLRMHGGDEERPSERAYSGSDQSRQIHLRPRCLFKRS